MMKTCLRLFVIAILLSIGPAAKAALVSSISFVSCEFGCSNPIFVNNSVQDGTALSYSNQHGSVFAKAGYGTLKASADSTFVVPDSGGGFISESAATAYTGFTDWIAFGGITGPQLVTIVLRLNGSLGTNGDGMSSTSGNVGVTLSVNGNLVSLNADRFGTITNIRGTYSQTVLTAVFELDYGVQLTLDGSLAVDGQFGGYARYGNTVDLEFMAPLGTTIQSGSGTAYRLNQPTSIQEPRTWVLLGIALATWAVACRRPRQA